MPKRGSSALPDYAEREEIPLRAAREIGPAEIALAAAKAGALGGAVGPIPRGMISYEDWLSDIKSRPVVFRGIRGDVTDPRAPLATSAFRGAYASPNPALAATYATPSQADLSEYGGEFEKPANRVFPDPDDPRNTLGFYRLSEGGSIYPLRATSQDANIVSDEQLDRMGKKRMDRYYSLIETVRDNSKPMHEREAAEKAIRELHLESDLNTLTAETPRGAINVRRAELPDTWAEYPPLDPSHLSAHPSDTYSWADPSAVEVTGKPFKANETSELLRAAAKRLGYPEEGLQNQRWSRAKDALQGFGDSPYSYVNEMGYGRKTQYTDKARELIEEVQNDPRFLPTNAARARQFLRGAATEALRPVNLLKDAAWGAGAGALSAVAGYESARPTSGGRFLPPGPGYENVESVEDILAVAAQKELEREARRQQYIKEARAMGEAASDDARVSELANILGPIR